MESPAKAMFLENLCDIDDPSMAGGAHAPAAKTFVENGCIRKGYLKKIAGDYTQERANYVMLSSIILRMVLGDRAPDERPVYEKINGKNKFVGTLSLAIPDFKNFAYKNDVLPKDPVEADRVAPCLATLLEKNVAAILLMNYYLRNDDLHPGNIGMATCGNKRVESKNWLQWVGNYSRAASSMQPAAVNTAMVDLDRCLSQGPPRTVGGQVNSTSQREPQELEKNFLKEFPKISLPIHWVTNEESVSMARDKAFPRYTEFCKLAGNEIFHRQAMTASLQVLLMHQPAQIKEHLKEYLGEDSPFIEKAMPEIQAIYDDFYRTVVIYWEGCQKNSYGARVPSFQEFLHKTPLAFQAVKADVQEYNLALENEYGEHQAKRFQISEQALESHYHQIWRDSKVSSINQFSCQIIELIDKLEKGTEPKTCESKFILKSPVCNRREINTASQVLKKIEYQSNAVFPEKRSAQGPSNKIKASVNLIALFETLHKDLDAYIKLERSALTHDSNTQLLKSFLDAESKLTEIRQLLVTEKHWLEAFKSIEDRFYALKSSLEWLKHLANNENKSFVEDNAPKTFYIPISYRNPEVAESCMRSLFSWVDTLSAEDFKAKMDKAIENYDPGYNIVSNRVRAEPVRKYLAASTETQANKLARILSEGALYENSLNTLIIKEFFPEMINAKFRALDTNIESARRALHDEQSSFDWNFYVKKANHLAMTDANLMHAQHESMYNNFTDYCYNWAESLDREDFKSLLESKIFPDYDKKGAITFFGWNNSTTFSWNNKSTTLIKEKLNDAHRYPNKRILAMMLETVDNDTRLAGIMFDYLWDAIGEQAKKPENKHKPEWAGLDLLTEADKTGYKKLIASKARENLKAYESQYLLESPQMAMG